MVNYLCRTGVVEPGTKQSRGHGCRRLYTFGDVVALRLVAKLLKNGISALRLKVAMKGLRKFHPEITLTSLPADRVVTDGKDIFLHSDGENVERAFDGQLSFAFVIELQQLQAEVAALLKVPKRRGGAGRKAA